MKYITVFFNGQAFYYINDACLLVLLLHDYENIALASYGCCNELPQTWQLKTAQIDSLIVPEAEASFTGLVPSEGSRRSSLPLPFLLLEDICAVVGDAFLASLQPLILSSSSLSSSLVKSSSVSCF